MAGARRDHPFHLAKLMGFAKRSTLAARSEVGDPKDISVERAPDVFQMSSLDSYAATL